MQATDQAMTLFGVKCTGSRNVNFIGNEATSIRPKFIVTHIFTHKGNVLNTSKKTFGFEISDLIFTGFGLFATYLSSPWVLRETSVPKIGLTDEIVQRGFPMMSCSSDEARTRTSALVTQAQAQHGSQIPTALLPSILRKTPLIYVDSPHRLVAPIPETILLRVTAGLYYDLFPGGQDIINDANDRFEQYCVDLIDALMERFEVRRAYRYGPKGAQFESPDVLVKDQGKRTIIAECKATKLTYLAQFAENPFEAAKKQYTQIAKGIFQLWRFFSHVRRGIVEENLALDCHAVVFTLDAFMQMGRDPQNKVFAEANALADGDGNIAPEDRKHVVICPIHDLEYILVLATEDSLLSSLKASSEDKYQGWMLREVHRNTGATKQFEKPKRYPFDMEKVLPWWSRLSELNEKNKIA